MTYTTFFYDKQIRRFLTQFIRIMSNFQVRLGNDDQGDAVYQRVPVFYADASRQASQILRSNSENTIKAVPAMAVHISGITYDRDRVQEPYHVSKLNIRTREYDPEAQAYTNRQGGVYTVERLMPVPYTLELKVDVWTSNTEQKLMLLEQVMILFNPALEIQSTDNYIDWTSLSYVLLTSIDWTNRSVPASTEENIDIASLTFSLPIWISAPAKVKQLGVVSRILANVYDPDGNITDPGDTLFVQHLTFENYTVLYQGNTLKLLKTNDINATNTTLDLEVLLKMRHSWSGLLDLYGVIRNGLSTVRLMQPNGIEVVGTIAAHPTDDTLLLYTPFGDTLPANTLPPINAIINPQNVDVESALINPPIGTRYLLTQPIGSVDNEEFASAWNPDGVNQLIAQVNDIVEFDGIRWSVSFDSANENSVHYVTNLNTGSQYRWSEGVWTKSIEGRYDNSMWSLTL
jgi:hypothetical protein